MLTKHCNIKAMLICIDIS